MNELTDVELLWRFYGAGVAIGAIFALLANVFSRKAA